MVEDSNPERRNLTVISSFIIIFYIGGGSLKNANELQLELINITYSNPAALAWLIWMAFGWFLFRYFVTIRQVFLKEWFLEIQTQSYGLGWLNRIVRRRHNLNAVQKLRLYWLISGSESPKMRLVIVGDVEEGSLSPHHIKDLGLTKIQVFIARVAAFLMSLLLGERLTANLPPLLLALTAISLKIWFTFMA